MTSLRGRGERNGRAALTLAAALLLGAVGFGARDLLFWHGAVTVPGTVVSNRRVVTVVKGDEVISFRPTVRFGDGRGVAREIEAGSGVDAPLPVGSPVPVLYPPGDPASARVGGEFFGVLPLGLAAGAGYFGLWGVGLVAVSRWAERRRLAKGLWTDRHRLAERS